MMMRKMKTKIHMLITKNIIQDKEYRTNRMKIMADNLIYWNSREHNYSKLEIERDYCRKMQEIYTKRFMYYKNHT